ncbi:hypothetical protein MPTK1_7g03570 [Marchantia polymorpha subsp. ruderalis]
MRIEKREMRDFSFSSDRDGDDWSWRVQQGRGLVSDEEGGRAARWWDLGRSCVHPAQCRVAAAAGLTSSSAAALRKDEQLYDFLSTISIFDLPFATTAALYSALREEIIPSTTEERMCNCMRCFPRTSQHSKELDYSRT